MTKGFFHETIPSAPIGRLALLRLDGDTYESTMSALQLQYDKVSLGGYCVVDDYYAFSDCRRAVDEFRAARRIAAELVHIDNISVYWQKIDR